MFKIKAIVWNVLFGTLFSRIAYFSCMPFLAVYLSQRGISSGIIGIIIASSAISGLGSCFFGGILTDKLGSEKVLSITAFVWGINFIAFTVANTWWSFLFANIMNGICYSIFELASKKIISDYTEESTRLLVFNLRISTINIGSVLGPMLALSLGNKFFYVSFCVLGITYFFYGSSIYITKRVTKQVVTAIPREYISWKKALNIVFDDKILLVTILGAIFIYSGYSHLSSTLVQYFNNNKIIPNGVILYSYLLSVNGIVILLIQYPIVKVMKKFTPFISISLGCTFISFSLLMFSWAKNNLFFIVIMIIFSIGEILFSSMFDILIDQLASPDLKGTYFGAAGFSRLGTAIGPMTGGFLIETFGTSKYKIIFTILGLLCLLGSLFIYIAHKLYKKKNEVF